MILSAYLINGQPLGTVIESWSEIELNGNPPFKVSEILPSGYADISSITNWDIFSGTTGKDIKFIKRQIYSIRVSVGYSNLTLEEKIIANKYLASDVEYNNAEVSITQQEYFFSDFYKPQSDLARSGRDLAVTGIMVRWLYTGILNPINIGEMIMASKSYRTDYLRDGIEGIGFGDAIDGILNFCQNSSTFSPLSITGVDTVAKTFTVSGDKTSLFIANGKLRVYGSTGNDAIYTVSSSSFDNTNTNITVIEPIASAVVNGDIYIKGFLFFNETTTYMQSELLDVYINGNY